MCNKVMFNNTLTQIGPFLKSQRNDLIVLKYFENLYKVPLLIHVMYICYLGIVSSLDIAITNLNNTDLIGYRKIAHIKCNCRIYCLRGS